MKLTEKIHDGCSNRNTLHKKQRKMLLSYQPPMHDKRNKKIQGGMIYLSTNRNPNNK